MDRIGKVISTLSLSILTGLTASGCKQTTVIPTPFHSAVNTVSRIHLLGPSLSISTTNLLVTLGLDNVARHSPRDAFERIAPIIDDNHRSPALLVAAAELASESGNRTSLTAPDESIIWFRNAGFLAAACLSFSQNDPAETSILLTAYAIHNQSIAACFHFANTNQTASRNHWPQKLAAAGIRLTSRVPEWTALGFDRLELAAQHRVTGITPMGQHSGFGVPLIAHRVLDNVQTTDFKPYGPDVAVFAATAVVQPPQSLTGWRSQPVEFTLLDPLNTDTVDLGNQPLPLAIDLTIPLTRRLSQSSVRKYEYLGVVDPAFYNARAAAYAVDPYQPGKIPVLFVHGLWSSPAVWVPMLDALRANPAIRARFQFWVVLYPSGYPLPIAAQSVRNSLREIRQRFDPMDIDPTLKQMVVIGKSTGGQVARMLVQSSGSELWNSVFTRPIEELRIPRTIETDLASAFFYQPEHYIRTAVFITTPHRGGNLARQPGASLGVNLIRQNNPLRVAWDDLQAANDPEAFRPLFRKNPPSSLDGMRAGNPILTAIDSQTIAANVSYHSIIATLHPSLPRDSMTDGFVRYTSAHIEGAASERIVTSSHLCEANPQVIAEVQRILLSQ